MVKIYGLVCPLSGEIRYIGKTVRTLERRLYAHITETRKKFKNSHKHRWIRKCLREGQRPTITLLEDVPSCGRWQERERAWIKKALAEGWRITNQTAGGEGLDFLDPVAKQAYAAKIAAGSKARYNSDERLRTAFREGGKRSWAENRQARIDACQAGWTPESKRRHKETMAAISKTPEFKAAKSRGQKAAWENNRDAFMAAFAAPECKTKQSESKKKSWKDPATRIRLMNRWTPEARQRQAEELRARMARMVPTSEGRERQRKAMREYWAQRKAK